MSQYLLIWILLSILLLLFIVCRWSPVLYVLAALPIIFLVLFFALKRDVNSNADKRDFFANFVYGGHRGSPRNAPENSIPAFQKAAEEGAQLMEFDIQLSADVEAILMHDDETGRVAERNLKVSKTTAETLLDTQLKPVNGTYAKIPSLLETVEWCKSNNTKMLFDVKDGDPKLLDQLAAIIRGKDLYSRVIVSSFNPFVPYYLKWIDRRILTGYTNRRNVLSNGHEEKYAPLGEWYSQLLLEIGDSLKHLLIETMLLPRFLGVDMLLLNHRDISLELVSHAAQYDMEVVAWTVNDENEMKWMRDVAHIPFLTDEPYKVKEMK